MFAASKTASVSGGYQIQRSLRFNSADSASLTRTPASASNRKTWTWSGWVKRSLPTSGGIPKMLFGARDGNFTLIYFDASTETIKIVQESSTTFSCVSLAVYRDFSAWYHIVVAIDTTQATAADRVKLYINGQQSAFNNPSLPSQNIDTFVNTTFPHTIGAQPSYGNFFDGYMTDINFIDGQALTPSSFGETNAQTGVWTPKAYSGSYGTNGFYLNFSDNSNTTAATLGKDYSGNGNNWTPNNFSVTAGAGNDSLVDSPTSYGSDSGAGGEVRGNYGTWNPVAAYGSSAANGNLDATVTGSGFSGKGIALGTIGVSSGKWYWEVTNISGNGYILGISDNAGPYNDRSYSSAYGWAYFSGNGNKYNNGTNSAYGATYTTNDVIGVALDMDAGTLTFYKNGTSQGVAYTGLNTGRTVTPMVSDGSGSTNQVYYANFGQRAFAYTAPSGFQALCTQNLPTPTIGATTATLSNKYFDVVLRNGGGSSGGTYSTNVNMANGAWLWDKPRSATAINGLVDSVRGISKYLISSSTAAEATDANWFTNFGTNTFTTGSSDWGTGTTVVDWIWAAGGSGSTNTAGSITSTVSANTTSGFSVVTFTGNSTAGATIGHGLGVAPSMVIMKNRAALDSWQVYHKSLPSAAYRLQLNSTAAADVENTVWNSTAPTSTVFSVGTNAGNYTQVAYCFAEVAGYSAFGSYTGNGSADGPFVYTGFRPAYVMIKSSSNASNWTLLDSKRNTYNVVNQYLNAENSNPEGTFTFLDFTSNGFKIRTSDTSVNGGDPRYYIYMAFAENPFKYSLAR